MSVCMLLAGCDNADYSLDKSIPRLQSPGDSIAWIRTKWRNGLHIETVFYDRQNRVLESFNFGRSSRKVLNFYEKDMLVKSISYWHGDSDELNTAGVDTTWYEYDKNARLVVEKHRHGFIPKNNNSGIGGGYTVALRYTTTGDTVKTSGANVIEPGNITDIERWERDGKARITSHFKLYILHKPQNDTTDFFTRKYAYDVDGKLKMAWFGHMYLKRYYSAAGPDTIWYSYDKQNRVVKERHRYTTNMRNKQEIDTTQIPKPEMDYIRKCRKGFFEGDGYFPKNEKVDIIEYRYEQFDPQTHSNLNIPY